MNKNACLWLLFMILGWSTVSGAATDTWNRNPVYLSKDALSVTSVLSGPPAPGSVADVQDYKALLNYQNARKPEDCTRAGSEVSISLAALYGQPYGILDAEQIQKLNAFFESFTADAGYFTALAKGKWSRPRPYLEHADVHPCVPLEKSTAFPSGHTTIARVYADILSQLFPLLKTKIMARSDQIAEDRVLAGVHHTTDIEAGKKLGDAIAAALSKSPKFQAALKAAQSQLSSNSSGP